MMQRSSKFYFEDLDCSMTSPDQRFNPMYVEQILAAQKLLFTDMCQAAGVSDFHNWIIFLLTCFKLA